MQVCCILKILKYIPGMSLQVHLYWAMKNCGGSPNQLRHLIENVPHHYMVHGLQTQGQGCQRGPKGAKRNLLARRSLDIAFMVYRPAFGWFVRKMARVEPDSAPTKMDSKLPSFRLSGECKNLRFVYDCAPPFVRWGSRVSQKPVNSSVKDSVCIYLPIASLNMQLPWEIHFCKPQTLHTNSQTPAFFELHNI